MSADGRFVAFRSDASDLTSGDTNGTTDIFIRDLQLNTTALVSIKSGGTGSGGGSNTRLSISPDGRFVLFESAANDLVPNDNNARTDVFLRDTVLGTTTLVSVNCAGTGSGNAVSFLWDYDTQNFTPDGRFVTFISDATDLVPGNYSAAGIMFRRDLLTGTTVLVSQNSDITGTGNSTAREHTISTNGSIVGFTSFASDLLSGVDGNRGSGDVFTWNSGAVVVTSPDLVLDKSASTGAVMECVNFTYTLTVTNNGTATASSVNVNDVLPAGVTFVSAITSQGSVTNSGGNITASLGTLNIGSSASVLVTVTAAAAGNVTNTASASSSTADATPANNSDSAIVNITPLIAPTIGVTPTNSTQLLLTWPSSTPNVFAVETTTNLTPVIVWSSVTNAITDNGTVKFVILDVNVSEPERYYRLKK